MLFASQAQGMTMELLQPQGSSVTGSSWIKLLCLPLLPLEGWAGGGESSCFLGLRLLSKSEVHLKDTDIQSILFAHQNKMFSANYLAVAGD